MNRHTLHEPSMHAQRQPSVRRGRQAGVTLIIMLIMLIIIGLTSVAVMRSALSSDMVSNNARLQTVAMQAAQIALRYCEGELVKSTPAITIRANASPAAWLTFTNWHGSGAVAATVPTGYFADASVAPVLAKRPQCLAEHSTMADGKDSIIVTARGFSGDFATDTNGNTTAGSVVWLQSTVQLVDTSTP